MQIFIPTRHESWPQLYKFNGPVLLALGRFGARAISTLLSLSHSQLLSAGLRAPEEPLPHTFSMFQKLVVQEVHRNTHRNSSRMLKDDLKIKTLYTGFCTVSVQARGLNTP